MMSGNCSSGYHEISVNFAILKVGICQFRILFGWYGFNFFKVNPSVPMAVEIEKTTAATSTRFRFDSPFAKVATAQDEVGGFNGYPL